MAGWSKVRKRVERECGSGRGFTTRVRGLAGGSRLACAFVLLCGSPGFGSRALSGQEANAESPAIREPRVDAVASQLVRDGETPGLGVLVLRDGVPVHRAAYGRSSPEGSPVTFDTPFYIASTGKMFTAAAVFRLVDQGQLALSDPLGEHLPSAPVWARDVPVSNLLDHTAGIPDHYDIGGEDRTWSNAQVLQLLRQQSGPIFEAGTRASYSNAGYVLLSLLVESVSGLSLGEFTRREFFEPLGMTSTSIVDDETRAPNERAIGFHRTANGYSPDDYASTTTGAGGFYSSLADLERWADGLRSGVVLNADALRLATTPRDLPAGRLTPFGMGWLAEFHPRGPLADRWYVFAYGSLDGFRAAFQWYFDEDDVIIWLSNSDSDAVTDGMLGLGDGLFADAPPR